MTFLLDMLFESENMERLEMWLAQMAKIKETETSQKKPSHHPTLKKKIMLGQLKSTGHNICLNSHIYEDLVTKESLKDIFELT